MAERGRQNDRRNLTGTVSEFDAASGLGTIEGPAGPVSFHCIEIANGSRSVDPGAAVTFDLAAKLGRWEAVAIRT